MWLDEVLSNGGEYCRNCSTDDVLVFRALIGREIDACGECGDAAFDVYERDDELRMAE